MKAVWGARGSVRECSQGKARQHKDRVVKSSPRAAEVISSAQAAVTECRLGGLETKTFVSLTPGGWEVQDQGGGQVGFVLRPPLAWRRPPSAVCSHDLFLHVRNLNHLLVQLQTQ